MKPRFYRAFLFHAPFILASQHNFGYTSTLVLERGARELSNIKEEPIIFCYKNNYSKYRNVVFIEVKVIHQYKIHDEEFHKITFVKKYY